MRLALIAAMGRNRVIGQAGRLPWAIPDEYAHFLRSVAGHPVLFGRTSWEIFGRDLTDSRSIVVSRTARRLPGAERFGDLDEALAALADEPGTVFCAGGASLYRQTLPRADELHLSVIKAEPEGDARFPEIDPDDWRVERREDHQAWEFRLHVRAR